MVLTERNPRQWREEKIRAITEEIDRKLLSSEGLEYESVLLQVMSQYSCSRRTSKELLDVALVRAAAERREKFIVGTEKKNPQEQLPKNAE